ncbi:hypothetical protein GCM10023322_25240 [Rugosimonospora acidiphila]|uniref:Uncharacterized protein n=1 Tax=Rugosimonospora acidiphila TaxID=556531 RepID=A0ABP9RRR8_9ACTN
MFALPGAGGRGSRARRSRPAPQGGDGPRRGRRDELGAIAGGPAEDDSIEGGETVAGRDGRRETGAGHGKGPITHGGRRSAPATTNVT